MHHFELFDLVVDELALIDQSLLNRFILTLAIYKSDLKNKFPNIQNYKK